jgi:hypothetical protein
VSELHAHYHQLLGLPEGWDVESVEILESPQRVTIQLKEAAEGRPCPECGNACGRTAQEPVVMGRLVGSKLRSGLCVRLPELHCQACGPDSRWTVFLKWLQREVWSRVQGWWTFCVWPLRMAVKAFKNKMRKNMDRRLLAKQMGSRELFEVDQAEYAYQIRARRKLYRRMDLGLWLVGIRYIPKECRTEDTLAACPNLTLAEPAADSVQANLWHAFFSESMLLVRHDDVLNWQKFHYMLVVYGVLVTGYVLCVREGVSWYLPMVLGAFGMALAWGADLTFQEGLRCLRAHRRKVAALERKSVERNTTFLLSGNAYNQRDVLEAGPAAMFLVSLLMFLFAAASLLWASAEPPRLRVHPQGAGELTVVNAPTPQLIPAGEVNQP